MTDLTPEAQALLDLARDGDAATDSDRDRVRRGIAATLGAGAFATTTATAAAKVGAGAAAGAAGTATATASVAGTKFAAWVAVGLVTGLGGVATVSSLSETPTSSSAPAVTARVTEPAKAPMAPPPENQAVAARDSEEHMNAPPLVAKSQTVHPPRSNVSSPAGERDEASSLLVETRLIERAQSALAQGKPSEALNAARDHRQRYPNGVLTPERLAVQAVASCKLGDREGARRSAAELKRIAPASPLWPRVQQACSFE